jgi:hypothetical protein
MPRSKRSKAKRSREKIRTLVPTRVDDRGRHEQRSMRLNDAFDNFRREIEGATNPWSSMLDLRFPAQGKHYQERLLLTWSTEETDTIYA